MGGKALNRFGVNTERKNTEDFLKIAEEIQKILKSEFNFILETAVVKYYNTKKDHGDLDLLIKVSNFYNGYPDLKNFIETIFKPIAINNNGGVISFDYLNFQIDFIPIKESYWKIANTYFSYDPLGNIMGKTFHKFGLSYGWNGLFYKFRNFNGRLSQNILISTDPMKIFQFGGYDYEKYLQGFETLEEIFEYCIDNNYFNSNIFKFENLKHIDKKRNRKRGSYHLFLNYVEKHDIQHSYEFHQDKDLYLPIINDFFPEANLMNRLSELKAKDKENKILSQKFNGEMVMTWLPKLMGKEVGNAITKFKNSLGDDYKNFVLNSNYNTIYEYFMKIYNNNK